MPLSSLLPKEYSFFDYFEEHAQHCVEAAMLFVHMVEHAEVSSRTVAIEMKELEHMGDRVTHKTLATLHKTFITPLDREEIHQLISGLDDILDAIDATTQRYSLYEVTHLSDESLHMATTLLNAVGQVQIAVKYLRNMKNAEVLLKTCVEINRLENEGDNAYREAMARLFRENANPIYVIKHKEIYEFLENAIDACESVANLIEGIVLEHS